EGRTQTQPRRTTGQPIAYADIDFDNQLVLPKGVGNAGDDAIEHEIHERAPGGPSRGGAGEGAGETDRPRGPSLTLPAATLFGAQTKLGDDPMIAVSENFVVATDASTIFFYSKRTGKLITPPSPSASLDDPPSHCSSAANAGGMCMEQFFAPFLARL